MGGVREKSRNCGHFFYRVSEPDSLCLSWTIRSSLLFRVVTRYVFLNADPIFVRKFLILDPKAWPVLVPQSYKYGTAWSLIPKRTPYPDPMVCAPWLRAVIPDPTALVPDPIFSLRPCAVTASHVQTALFTEGIIPVTSVQSNVCSQILFILFLALPPTQTLRGGGTRDETLRAFACEAISNSADAC